MRKKFIEVYDNLFNPEEIELIKSRSLDYKFPWYYVHNIAYSNHPKLLPGLTHCFLSSLPDKNPHSSPYDYSFFYLNILYRLAKEKNILIEQIHTGRLFMHLPSSKSIQDPVHIDLDFPHLVCLYYVTDSDGDTILYEDDGETEIQRITPKKGRIVFFDGTIPHCSSRPIKNTRVVVNFDFQGYKFGKEEKN